MCMREEEVGKLRYEDIKQLNDSSIRDKSVYQSMKYMYGDVYLFVLF